MKYEVTDEELRRFMESNPRYAKYRDNLALARILYAKHAGAVVAGIPQTNTDKLRLFKGMRVKLVGVVAGYVTQEYEACIKCFKAKRKCECGETGTVKRYVIVYTVGDNFGNVDVVSWQPEVDEQYLNSLVGAEVEVIGRVDEDEDGYKILLSSIRVLDSGGSSTSSPINDVLRILREARYMNRCIFEKFVQERGIDLSALSGFIEVRGDNVYPKG